MVPVVLWYREAGLTVVAALRFFCFCLTLCVSVSLRDALIFFFFCTDCETVLLKESANQNFLFTFLGSICNFDGEGV
jgi:hypothetical protein